MATLMVGGTGMLSDAAIGLAQRREIVHLVSRHRDRFEDLRRRAGPWGAFLRWHPADYRDAASFRAALEAAWSAAPYHRVVLWGSDPAAWAELTTTVSHLAGAQAWALYFVRGSQHWNGPPPSVPPTCTLRIVILGFVLQGPTQARWLTHQEISQGVLDAVIEQAPYRVVGTVHPWDRRPAW